MNRSNIIILFWSFFVACLLKKNGFSHIPLARTTDKWSLRALRGYFREQGVDNNVVWKRVEDLIVKTLILADGPVNTKMQRHRISQDSCFELFGFDVLFDANYKPWLMEVNIGPSVATGTKIDKMVNDHSQRPRKQQQQNKDKTKTTI